MNEENKKEEDLAQNKNLNKSFFIFIIVNSLIFLIFCYFVFIILEKTENDQNNKSQQDEMENFVEDGPQSPETYRDDFMNSDEYKSYQEPNVSENLTLDKNTTTIPSSAEIDLLKSIKVGENKSIYYNSHFNFSFEVPTTKDLETVSQLLVNPLSLGMDTLAKECYMLDVISTKNTHKNQSKSGATGENYFTGISVCIRDNINIVDSLRKYYDDKNLEHKDFNAKNWNAIYYSLKQYNDGQEYENETVVVSTGKDTIIISNNNFLSNEEFTHLIKSIKTDLSLDANFDKIISVLKINDPFIKLLTPIYSDKIFNQDNVVNISWTAFPGDSLDWETKDNNPIVRIALYQKGIFLGWISPKTQGNYIGAKGSYDWTVSTDLYDDNGKVLDKKLTGGDLYQIKVKAYGRNNIEEKIFDISNGGFSLFYPRPKIEMLANGSSASISVDDGTAVTITWEVSGASSCELSSHLVKIANWKSPTGSDSSWSGTHKHIIAYPDLKRNFAMSCKNKSGFESFDIISTKEKE